MNVPRWISHALRLRKSLETLSLPGVILLCSLSIIFTLWIRIPILDQPYFGSHLFRQLQTVSTIEAYIQDGIDLLHPRTNYIGYPGHLLLEFPIFQAIAATLSNLLNQDPLPLTRSLNLLIGITTIVFVYKISRLYLGSIASFLSGIFFFLAPLNLMYHVSSLIDPLAVLSSLIATYLFLKHKKTEIAPPFFILLIFLLMASLTVLLKPLYLFPLSIFMMADLKSLFSESSFKTRINRFFSEKVKFWVMIALAAFVMFSWLYLSSHYSSAQDVSSHIGWKVLTKPSYYLTIAIRYFFYDQTPLSLVFAVIGFGWAFRNHKTLVLFSFIPFAYYLVFANINRPHDYYSLILVPFISIASAAGIQQIIDWTGLRTVSTFVFTCSIIPLCLTNSLYLYFTNYWLSPSTVNRYQAFSDQMEPVLLPFEYSLVFIDRDGPFETDEFLAESRRDLIAAKLGKLDVDQLKASNYPLYEPAVLYSLNHQYGEMNWYSKRLDPELIKQKISQYDGNLKYLIVLMPSDANFIEAQLSNCSLIYKSSTVLVFEPKSFSE